MSNNNDPKLTPLAQQLRKNMTKEESRLWYGFLRKLPFRVNRQKVIGKYIVDFYCAAKKTAIEIDGEQHFTEKGILHDRERDAYLRSRRINVLRYSNQELNNSFDGVCRDIYLRLIGLKTEPQDIEHRRVTVEELISEEGSEQ